MFYVFDDSLIPPWIATLAKFSRIHMYFYFFYKASVGKNPQEQKQNYKKPEKNKIYKREGEDYKDEARFF